MAKPKITLTTSYDSPGTLVFWCQNLVEIPTSPPTGRQIEVGYVRIGAFRPISRYISETEPDVDILSTES